MEPILPLPGRGGPVSRAFGFDRGLPVDRYYIERFLERHAEDIRGRTLEFKDDTYARRFGRGGVRAVDILEVERSGPATTIVADLTRADHLPDARFDCIICTQTLQFIFDVPAALRTLARILRPGGVLLATVPGISQISVLDRHLGGEYWRFTTRSAQRLFETAFPGGDLSVRAYGNVRAAVALLQGLSVEDLRGQGLDEEDPDYEVLVAARAVKEAPA